jgi:hypothetical protein
MTGQLPHPGSTRHKAYPRPRHHSLLFIMSRNPPIMPLVLLLAALAILSAGCTAPPAQPQGNGNGSIHVTSVPPGAEVWLDNAYRGLTPSAIPDVPAGRHTVELRMSGYEPVTYPVTVVNGGPAGVAATLVRAQAALPVTVATTTTPPGDLPQVRVDGFWTHPQGRSGTANPVPLAVHTEAFNAGSVDAREVTVSANFYYEGRMVCWNTVYLGTLAAGGHVSRDSLFSCTLPSPMADQDLEVRFGNVVVTP